MPPLVDVLIPSYNSDFRVSVMSALAQEYDNIHVILYLDGKQPKWEAEAKKIAVYDHRVTVYIDSTGPHKDWGHTPRNKTPQLKLLKGIYTKMLDAGDILDRRCIKTMALSFKEKTVAVVCKMAYFKDRQFKTVYTGDLVYGQVGTGSLMIHNDIYEKVGYKHNTYGGDWNVIQDIMQHGPIVRINEVLYYYIQ